MQKSIEHKNSSGVIMAQEKTATKQVHNRSTHDEEARSVKRWHVWAVVKGQSVFSVPDIEEKDLEDQVKNAERAIIRAIELMQPPAESTARQLLTKLGFTE